MPEYNIIDRRYYVTDRKYRYRNCICKFKKLNVLRLGRYLILYVSINSIALLGPFFW